MSRWSADPLHIALAPGEVALLAGGESRLLATDARDAASLLPLLDEALADPAWPRRRVEVVLSQQFVRQVLTPPPGKALARAEESALVAASLREIYGDEAAGWRIAVHSQPPHAGLVGAAVDADFMQQLEALLARHDCRNVTISPLGQPRRAAPAEPLRRLVDRRRARLGDADGRQRRHLATPDGAADRYRLAHRAARLAGALKPSVRLHRLPARSGCNRSVSAQSAR